MQNLTAEHLPIGAVVQTKSGKTGVITHVHKKAGYLFIHNEQQGKTYHVSMASVTNVSGESAADILAKQGKGDGLGEDMKAAADKMVGKGPGLLRRAG